MRASEITKKLKLKMWHAKIKLPQTGFASIMDIVVTAKNQELARRLIKQLYGPNSRITNVKEIKN